MSIPTHSRQKVAKKVEKDQKLTEHLGHKKKNKKNKYKYINNTCILLSSIIVHTAIQIFLKYLNTAAMPLK